MGCFRPLRETPTTTGPARARGYSGASERRRRIDSLPIGETFTLAGFSFRVENFVFANRKKERRAPAYDSTAEYERPRNYPDLAYIVGLARRKDKKDEKGGGDRGQNRDHRLVQGELL